MNNIAKKIRQLRTQQGLSQEYMALELGITQPSYARLEREDCRINVVRLIQIAKILQVEVSALLDENSQNLIHTNNADNAQDYIKTLSPDKSHIASLKEEIGFLREVLKRKVDNE